MFLCCQYKCLHLPGLSPFAGLLGRGQGHLCKLQHYTESYPHGQLFEYQHLIKMNILEKIINLAFAWFFPLFYIQYFIFILKSFLRLADCDYFHLKDDETKAQKWK